MSEMKSLLGSEVRDGAGSCYAELLALRFFRRAILFFDEVDTFLDSREAVQQGHEKSMVNEVLQQMESFGGVFVGTTNFKDMLDPAVARRFTFKVELDYLDADGRCVFWKRFFGSQPTGRTRSRLDALEAELSAKTGVMRRIGFSE